MHFGRLASLDQVDLTLPDDSPRTRRFLALAREETETPVLIGCPIWACRSWIGSGIYPAGTKPAQYLQAYAQRFPTVEVNSTFYHLLDAERIARWRDEVPPSFRFCPKVYRGITEALAAPGMPQLVERFCEGVRAFGPTLGLVFAQLPETLGPRQGQLLVRFLQSWPTDVPLAVEFRHPAWFRDHSLLDELVNLLYRHRVATVITDTPGRRDALHLSLTQPRVMIRFLGHHGDVSDKERLQQWAERLDDWAQHDLEAIYFFTHQPSETLIPETALLMNEAWERTVKCGRERSAAPVSSLGATDQVYQV